MNKNYLKTSALAFIFSFFCLVGLTVSWYFLKKPINFPYLINHFTPKDIDYPLLSFVFFMLLALISFFTGSLDLASQFVNQKQIRNPFLRGISFTVIFLILPFYILFHLYFTFVKVLIFKRLLQNISKKRLFKNILILVFTFFILIPVWFVSYLTVFNLTAGAVLRISGYAPYTEYVAGTGSMYPTFPKGDKLTPIAQFNETVATPSFISYPSGVVIFGKRYFGRNLQRGDIVSFTNQKTIEITKKQYGVAAGFVKRVIALSGDTIQLRGGIVYLNGKPQREPYTAKPQSTFGEDFLSECKLITVPKGAVFVMGDNRKGSGDSREIGFIKLSDIDHVLPIENQKGVWDKNWRDTSKDFDASSKITLNASDYLKLLNAERAKVGVKPLKYEPKLEESAKIRAEAILKYDDFSFNATMSGITMQKAVSEAGYSNITYGEIPTQGYFEASELIDNQFQFPNTKQFLLNKDFQDFGVSEVEGDINSCPTQIIVQHFAGYVPPNYPADLIKSWEDALSSLNSIAKGWQDLKNYPDIYNKEKANIDRINDIITQRQSVISEILDKMHKNLWLTDAENTYTKTTDKALVQEESTLAQKINNSIK